MTSHTQAGRNEFPVTSWTLVVAAGNQGGQDCRDALARLCEHYWYPVYAYVRRRGYPVQEAQDLTQDFFLRILEGRYLDRADRNRGRFRSFLLNSCKFFLSDQADRAHAQKRGAGAILPFEVSSGEQRYRFEPLDSETPDSTFERNWAVSLLDCVVTRLKDEFTQHGSPADFEKLKVFLLGQSEVPYAELAREMGSSEGGLKVAVHRLRKRYRVLFQTAIAETVADPAEVDSEISFLISTLRAKS
jgi:DNA-directed RNA polymerase specialized sigma24 family protein